MKKLFIFLVINLLCYASKAQDEGGDYYNSWNFVVGRTGTPGDVLKIGLEVCNSPKVSTYFEASAEWSRSQNIKYSSYNLSVGKRYYIIGDNFLNGKIKASIGLGATIGYNHEPIIYKYMTFTEKLNYGVAGNIVGVYVYDPTIAFVIGFEQKYLLNKNLGNTNYDFNIGLRIYFVGN